MFRAALVRSLCVGILFTVGSIAFAQEFSADVVNSTGKDAAKSGKVYVKGNKMRIDRGDGNAGASAPLAIVDTQANTVTIMDAANHAYIKSEMGSDAGLSFFRINDANNACADLNKIAGMPSSCKKNGNESVNGRQTVKYTGKGEDGKPIVIWADPEASFVVKWQKDGDAGELRNIKMEPQAASLFEVPSDYHSAAKEQPKENDEKPADDKDDKRDKQEPQATTPQ